MTGKELKAKLLTTGKSIKEISDLMGMLPQSLNTIFNVADVKTGTLEKLCTVLGVTIDFFYEGTSYIDDKPQLHHVTDPDTDIGIMYFKKMIEEINSRVEMLEDKIG